MHTLVAHNAGQVIQSGGVLGCDICRADELQSWAHSELIRTRRSRPSSSQSHQQTGRKVPYRVRSIVACDVVVLCSGDEESTTQAVESVLSQRDAWIVCHLVHSNDTSAEVARRYSNRSNIRTYQTKRRGMLPVFQKILPNLRSQFIAIQHPQSTSRDFRIAYAVRKLCNNGSEIIATAFQTPAETKTAKRLRDGTFQGCISGSTFVLRRSTLIDSAELFAGRIIEDRDVLLRAVEEGRKVEISPVVTVDSQLPSECNSQALSMFSQDTQSAGDTASTIFHRQRIACDVVLPFCGQYDFLREAIESILAQNNVDAVIHLIDDAGSGDSDSFLQLWRDHDNVRIYRNKQNIGPYVSFNNVSQYFETPLVAVQDADDISLPNRLVFSGNSLLLADADIFAGRVEMFGDQFESRPDGQLEQGRIEKITVTEKSSRYPVRGRRYFAINPTVMMRVDAFRSLGGFADYGRLDWNKCGLDTEFYTRAHHAGMRLFISRKIVLRHRRHRDSATQNSRTGWGTAARARSQAECRKRFEMYEQGSLDARAFGGLGRYNELTERLKSGSSG